MQSGKFGPKTADDRKQEFDRTLHDKDDFRQFDRSGRARAADHGFDANLAKGGDDFFLPPEQRQGQRDTCTSTPRKATMLFRDVRQLYRSTRLSVCSPQTPQPGIGGKCAMRLSKTRREDGNGSASASASDGAHRRAKTWCKMLGGRYPPPWHFRRGLWAKPQSFARSFCHHVSGKQPTGSHVRDAETVSSAPPIVS